MSRWQRIISPFWPALLVGALVWLIVVQFRTPAPREFRGVLHTGIMQIGGETTGIIIVTANGAYELDVSESSEWRDRMHELDGHRVIVVGRLRVGKGIEVPERRIIQVHELTLE